MVIPALWYWFCARITYTEHFAALYERFGSFECLWQDITAIEWCRSLLQQKSWQRILAVKQNLIFYQDIWKQYYDRGMWFVTWQDQDYPELLRHIYAPPLVLCGQGNRSLLSKTCVSIVGTRQATSYGKTITAQIVQMLAPYDVLLVSGLAYGIDSVVHDTAQRLSLPSAGVIAASLLHAHWGGNVQLKDQLDRDYHLFLSETNSDERIQRFHFAKRNRLIAGMSKCTIVIEAPLISGALITARCAREENRDLLVVPHNLEQSMGAGCLLLLNDGAQVIMDVSDVPRLLGLQSPRSLAASKYQYENDLQKNVHTFLQQGSGLDVIAGNLQLGSSVLLGVITDLVLKGYVVQQPDGSYQAK